MSGNKNRKINITIEGEGLTIVKSFKENGDPAALADFINRLCADLGYEGLELVNVKTIEINSGDDLDKLLSDVEAIIGKPIIEKRKIKRVKLDNILLPPAE